MVVVIFGFTVIWVVGDRFILLFKRRMKRRMRLFSGVETVDDPLVQGVRECFIVVVFNSVADLFFAFQRPPSP